MSEAGGSEGNIPWKTPASLLQEMCAKKGFSPEYVSVSDGEPHDQLFLIHAVIGELRGMGMAKTKKVARQIAAKHLLEQLLTGPDSHEWPIPNISPSEALEYVRGLYRDCAQPVLPHDVEEKEGGQELADAAKAGGIYILPTTNYIGQLMEYIRERRFKHPAWAESEKGPPHLRDFTCQVTVGNFTESATAKQKKEAKQLAAGQMLVKLKEVPTNEIDLIQSLQLSNDEEVLPITDGTNGDHHRTDPLSIQVTKKVAPATAETLQQLITESEQRGWGTPVFQPVSQLSKTGRVQMLVKLNSQPEETVSYGEGDSELNAKFDAAAHALELMRFTPADNTERTNTASPDIM